MSDTDTCDVCGGEKPAAMLDETTVRTIDPMAATICEVCQHVQNHELPDDVCMQCGDAIETGFALELEFPLGPAALPGRLTGSLCGDCASWIACEINNEGVSADDEALGRYLELLERERELPVEA